MFDILESNSFKLMRRSGKLTSDGPYRLALSIKNKRLVFDIHTKEDQKTAEFHLSLTPFRQVVKDYWAICDSYYDAVKKMPPSQIETIDMGRKAIHDEGGKILIERFSRKAEIDLQTARRLFTLITSIYLESNK